MPFEGIDEEDALLDSANVDRSVQLMPSACWRMKTLLHCELLYCPATAVGRPAAAE